MNKKSMLMVNWTMLIVGFITAITLIIITVTNGMKDDISPIGPIIFFSIMFLAGFVGINIQYKDNK